MSERELDETDRRILHCLQGDARNVTTAEIGEQLEISGSTVANRITQLEDAGIIAGYAPIIDYERSGYDHHYLLVGTVSGHIDEDLVEAILHESGVVDVTALLTDERNVHVEVVADEPGMIEETARSLSELGVTVLRTEVVTHAAERAFDGFGNRNDSSG